MKPNIKRLIHRIGTMAMAAMIALSLGACGDKVGITTDIIELDVDYLSFTQAGGSETITVKSSIPGSHLTASVVDAEWCTAVFENGKLVVAALPNGNTLERNAVVKIMGDNVLQVLTVMQQGRSLTYNAATDGSFDYLTVFTDDTCAELKAGITQTQIDNIPSAFFRTLALELFNGSYDLEFRSQNYKPWRNPDITALNNKNMKYSKRDNPTGIYALKGEQIVFFADDVPLYNTPRVVVQNSQIDNQGKLSGQEVYIQKGLNVFTASNSGLMYVEYLTSFADEAPVKVNFVTGSVNGYFDIAKHAPEKWAQSLSKASFRHFDLVGEHAHLTFETEMFRKYTTDGTELVGIFDEMVTIEEDFMGLYKYNKAPKNRIHFRVADYEEKYMYATDYYTGYSSPTQTDILDVKKIKTTSVWGPAHEIGHVHQIQPEMRWHGMIEVTNNLCALTVQIAFGNRSRLMVDNPNYYEVAKRTIIEGELPHNMVTDAFCKLVPFWQLKLYLMDARGQTDFYRDLYERFRQQWPSPATDGDAQLNFVKAACEVAGLDLTDFFTAWGFFTPMNDLVDDYNEKRFIVTQEMIDAAKAEIAAMGLPKPIHDNIYDITDDNVDSYK